MNPQSNIEACAEAWYHCEKVLANISQNQTSFSSRTIQVLTECAKISFSMLQALKCEWYNVNQLALLCVGICEECADICEKYDEPEFIECATRCRNCAGEISHLAFVAV